MPINFLAGQRLTADDLQALAATRVTQGTEQSVASSTTLTDTSIVVPVNDLTEIRLLVRYTSLGGGMRWAWSTTSGSVTMYNRSIGSHGESTTGNAATVADMRWRQVLTDDEEQTVDHFTTNTSSLIWEDLIVDGDGELTFQFAQVTSDASETSIHRNSYATWQRLAA
ncbi:hypothetical protein [Salininema proteolyticum]|uniref:Uncharacterized protein n=1 Tax=Salininema proteolyticum TaxID=1607685 RepID=A0ABV8TSY4_9ACTN